METNLDIFAPENGTDFSSALLMKKEAETRSYHLVDADSQSIPEDLVRGFVIAVPIIAALILAPVLLSYSKRRFAKKLSLVNNTVARRRNLEHHCAVDCASPINIAKQEDKTLTTTKHLDKTTRIKPSLKRGKMFIESELTYYENTNFDPRLHFPPPNPVLLEKKNRVRLKETPAENRHRINSTPCILSPGPRIGSPKSRPVSVDLEEGWRRAGMDEIRCYENVFPVSEIVSRSRLTVYENAAYEDTIPSSVGSQLNIISTGTTPLRTNEVDAAETEDIYQEIQATCLTNEAQSSHQRSTVTVEIHDMRHNRDVSIYALSRDCMYEPAEDSFSYHLDDATEPKVCEDLRLSRKNDVRRHDRKRNNGPIAPSTNHGKESGNEIFCQDEVNNSFIEKTDPAFGLGSPSFPSEINETRDQPTPYDHRLSIIPHSPPSGIYDIDKTRRRTRKRKRKVKKSRKERNELRRKWQQRLLVPTPEVKSGTGDSYCSRNNEAVSGYIGNRHYSDVDLGQDGRNQFSSRRRNSEFQMNGTILRQRPSENTLLQEIWKHLTVLVEGAVASNDISTSDNDTTRTSSNSSTKTVVACDFV